jgi:hypothetical protein
MLEAVALSIDVAAELTGVIEMVMQQALPQALPEVAILAVKRSLEGRMPLALRASQKAHSLFRIFRARGYNAQNKGLGLLLYLHWAGFALLATDILQALFDFVQKRQSQNVRAGAAGGATTGAAYFGVDSAIAFNQLRLWLSEYCCGASTAVPWPLVFVFLCEAKQAANAMGPELLGMVHRERYDVYEREVHAALAGLMRAGAAGKCYMTALYDAAVAAIGLPLKLKATLVA